jgi:hypothetical protein
MRVARENLPLKYALKAFLTICIFYISEDGEIIKKLYSLV